ncbi:hypothetical protein CUR86_17870 [Salinicola acroporae]|uniref:Uncharacterized protein n=1 Tax=Salinicola acroporae TaxID=1541440 RepID=A0ABT6I980_9GAMM|nr:hypothetical protein [Salinicola acroporae]
MTHRESTLLVEMLVELLVKRAAGALRGPASVNAITVSGVSATGTWAAAVEAMRYLCQSGWMHEKR